MPTAVDHLEAALARITREDIATLPPERRRRLQATLGSWSCLCDDLVQPKPNGPLAKSAAKPGVLSDLQRLPRDE
jgi:hypothetical protein